ncbi:MFS transporter, DHA1 family, inner membrane transport protein [Quadrisphaera granulorum]|uniref:DHA1 family inner membrane transport protein n=1 Tax=Quadrisphaera granulorum TaxID=317664 RepID=A0A316ABU1_9ACTN|nr:MFS transporter [Quadrisphaera granulorum]PWJ55175.1 DHA1 family inner membrane transport protein [Quadrisphaera granulorum]SZE95684.1 MFS transporter, DHA1 family, inner membrane transport protein [Quadrisphaera granulorum]
MTRLLSLTLAAFAIGISEFVLVGLLPTIAAETGVSVGAAGLLVTAYALAITVLSPLLTSWFSRFDSRWVLVALMGAFAIGNTLVATAAGFAALLAGRVLAGAAHGTVFAIGAPAAAALVPREKASRAISLVFLGLTVAMVVGVPLGTVLGNAVGWRATFVVVAVLGGLSAAAIAALIPSTGAGEAVSLRGQLALLRDRPLALTYVVTGLGFGATFAVFTYLEPLLSEGAGYNATGVTILLLLFGAATVVGNLAGGALADRRGTGPVIHVALVGLAVCFTGVLLSATSAVAIAITVAVWGVFAFLISPPLQAHAVALARGRGAGAEKAASGLNIAAFNAGIALASWAGGVVLEAAGATSTPWVALVLVLLALAVSPGIISARARGAVREGVS